VQTVFKNLLSKRVSIWDSVAILEALSDSAVMAEKAMQRNR